jgi:hypothetical protein
MHERMQIFHLISHFDDHHRREKDSGTNIRHLLHPLAPKSLLSYPGGATVDVIELGLLADKVLVAGSTLAEAKPYAAVRSTEIPAWPLVLGPMYGYLRGHEETLQCAFHGVDGRIWGSYRQGG